MDSCRRRRRRSKTDRVAISVTTADGAGDWAAAATLRGRFGGIVTATRQETPFSSVTAILNSNS